jgi:pyridoxal biosynthesis lyase PdxS
MGPRMSRTDFDAMVRQAGLTLTEAETAELHQAVRHVEAMAANVRQPRGRDAEPAHVFNPMMRA